MQIAILPQNMTPFSERPVYVLARSADERRDLVGMLTKLGFDTHGFAGVNELRRFSSTVGGDPQLIVNALPADDDDNIGEVLIADYVEMSVSDKGPAYISLDDVVPTARVLRPIVPSKFLSLFLILRSNLAEASGVPVASDKGRSVNIEIRSGAERISARARKPKTAR